MTVKEFISDLSKILTKYHSFILNCWRIYVYPIHHAGHVVNSTSIYHAKSYNTACPNKWCGTSINILPVSYDYAYLIQ